MGLLEKIKKAFGGEKKEEQAPTEGVSEQPSTPPVTPTPPAEEEVGSQETGDTIEE